jgi:Flp pilus assembly protein TadB
VPNRKEAVRAQRAKDKAMRDREYQAMQTGDERYLPARDKGPVRRWVRDYVDARRNPGEYFLPAALVVVMATFVAQQNPIAAFAIIIALYLVVIVTVVDAIVLGRRVKKRVTAKFGEEKVPRGIAMYAILRSLQMRRTRLPKPRVERGAYPR